MGAVAAVLFEKEEKYDAQFAGRAPRSLLEAVAKLAKEHNQSKNETLVKLLTIGVNVFRWMADRRARIDALRHQLALFPPELVVRMLDEGIAVLERQQKKR